MGNREAEGPNVLLIAGPTASGKSALALRLAARLGGIVINADSMQVYRDLRILTARPSDADERAVPHALYGTIDGAENHSVRRWLAAVGDALKVARADGRAPIIVGGTGLYFLALTRGLSEIPPVPDVLRAELRAWAAARSVRELHDELRRVDPVAAAHLRPTDPQRMLRALEVHAATGRSLTSFQANREPPVLDVPYKAYALDIDRAVLRARIDARFDAMVAAGALDEVAALERRELDPDLPVMRAIGVPPLVAHVRGEQDVASAIEAGKAATRRYIKRQQTFVRHQLSEFRSVGADVAETAILDDLQSS